MKRSCFRIYKDSLYSWAWECTLCQPPSSGRRFGRGAYEHIVATSLPRHFRVRTCHHNVTQRRGLWSGLPLTERNPS